MGDLLPDRPSEIDLVLGGERTGSGSDGAADQRTLKGRADHKSAERTDAGADPTTTYGAFAGTAAAPGQAQDRASIVAMAIQVRFMVYLLV